MDITIERERERKEFKHDTKKTHTSQQSKRRKEQRRPKKNQPNNIIAISRYQ